MKKQAVLLFCIRLFFYFSVTVLILVHPGITVSFDSTGYLLWFGIIPVEALIAFLPAPRKSFKRKCILAAIPLLVLSLYAGGFSAIALQLILAGALSFFLTFLLFYHPRWAKACALEPFFLAFVLLRLLAFSRSGEEAAGQSMAVTQFVFIWTAVVFLLHSAVVYLCLYPHSRENAAAKANAKKEGSIFLLASAAALLIVLVVLPADFVRNAVITNLRQERKPERIGSAGDYGIPKEAEGRRSGRRITPGGGGRQQSLRGIPENDWQDGKGRGGSEGKNQQYTVMIVASKYEPVFMGSVFRGQMDAEKGFLPSPEEPLNRLPTQRLFVTWVNNERNFDRGRRRQEVVSISTQAINYLPYRPVSIDPTIISENSGPLRYIHRVNAGAHITDPLELINTPPRSLSDADKNRLSHYLEIPLPEDDLNIFNDYINRTLKNWRDNREEIIQSDPYLESIFGNARGGIRNDYMETILALLTGFSQYQYNLSYSNDASINDIKNFLFESMDGDCVEFSNSLALLGRLAGIPSRVVTGYLAAEGLQTPAHLRGLAALYNSIPALREFPFNDLFLVTNAHGHSWTQFYIPEYGWLDFESTSFAIPPLGMGDISNWDVVIPVLDESKTFAPVRKFPWFALLRAVLFIAALALAGAYILRYGREAALYFGSRRGGRAGARALYLLLLARLAADGKPIKPASRTAHEYTELFAKINEKTDTAVLHFKTFAEIYSQLRWRTFADAGETDSRYRLLKQEYRNILKAAKRRSIAGFVIRIFSLRGLAYL